LIDPNRRQVVNAVDKKLTGRIASDHRARELRRKVMKA
jgi:hypothetical protein